MIELRSWLASRSLSASEQGESDPDTSDASTRSNPDVVVGYGEIAPLPWFGSETQTEALDFCRSWSGTIDDTAIDTIPDRLPACQFAFESARHALRHTRHQTRHQARSPHSIPTEPIKPLPICHLLPAGQACLAAIAALTSEAPHHTGRTYKWKIGTALIEHEFEIFQALLQRLPAGSKLRLDANGGLNVDQAECWLTACDRLNQLNQINQINQINQNVDRHNSTIEFIEQPLPPSQWHDLVRLSHTFTTPIALDESIASLAQLRAAQSGDWRGIYVIKPAIIGSPQRLRSFCREHQLDTVFSSVFETAIGRDAGLQLAQELQTRDRAVGYGLDDWLMP